MTDTVDVTIAAEMYRRFVPAETRVHFEGDGVDAWVVWMASHGAINPDATYRITIEQVEQ